MLTKWAKRILQSGFGIVPYGNSGNNYVTALPVPTWDNSNADIEVKACDGNTYFINGLNGAFGLGLVTSYGAGNTGFVVGSGDSAESEDSYVLDSLISREIGGVVSYISEKDVANSKRKRHININVTNTGNNTLTIREVGIICSPYGTATTRGGTINSSSSSRYPILMDRTVLESPITLAPSATALIRYTFEYDIS